MLREDNLGLGAQVGKGNAETFGLSMFSGLLGRLNGKSDEEVQKKQDSLRDAELRAWQANKHGYMNFVKGGLLVGDKMEFPESTRIEDVKNTAQLAEAKLKESKKRKAGEDEVEAGSSKKRQKSKSKSSKATSEMEEDTVPKEPENIKKRKTATEQEAQDEISSSESSKETNTRDEKRQRKQQRKAERAAKASVSASDASELDEKARLKVEKRALKEERRKRREEKRAKRAAKESAESSTQASKTTSANEGTTTPSVVNTGLAMTGGRHAVRQRYIMQKRMASMDATALKEIFMLQPQPAS